MRRTQLAAARTRERNAAQRSVMGAAGPATRCASAPTAGSRRMVSSPLLLCKHPTHPYTAHLPRGAAGTAGAVQQCHDGTKCRMQACQAVAQADVGPHWGAVGEAIQVPAIKGGREGGRGQQQWEGSWRPCPCASVAGLCIPHTPPGYHTALLPASAYCMCMRRQVLPAGSAYLKPPNASHTDA